MKLNPMIAASVLGLGFASVASAQVTNHVYLTGSTAARSQVFSTLTDTTGTSVFDAGTAVSVTFEGSSASGANYMQVYGTIGGTNYIINCHWSGSEAGVADIASPTSESFLADHGTGGVPNSGHTVGSPSGGQLVSATVDLAMTDTDKAFSQNPGAAITGTKVGVITFEWVKEKGSAAAISNVTAAQARVALAGGNTLALFTGNPADTGHFVYVSGRKNTSGTYANTYGITGYGIGTPGFQCQVDATGNMIDQDGLGIVPDSFLGAYGYESGGSVATQMGFDISGKTDPVNGGAFSVIAYVGLGDGNTAVANGGTALSYDGVPFSAQATKEGQYSFWGNELVYRKNSSTQPVTTVFTKLGAATGIGGHANGTTLIKLGDMHASRNGPTSDPVHF